MSWVKKIFNRLVDSMEQYNRYKAAAMLAPYVKDRDELESILKDLYK